MYVFGNAEKAVYSLVLATVLSNTPTCQRQVSKAQTIERYRTATCIPFAAKPDVRPHTREWNTPLALRDGSRVTVSGAEMAGGRIVLKYENSNRVEVAADAGDYVYPSDVRVDSENDLLYVKATGLAGGIFHETVLFEYDLRGHHLIRVQHVADHDLPAECPEGPASS